MIFLCRLSDSLHNISQSLAFVKHFLRIILNIILQMFTSLIIVLELSLLCIFSQKRLCYNTTYGIECQAFFYFLYLIFYASSISHDMSYISYSFTDPNVSPVTKYFCINGYMTRIGIVDATIFAALKVL